MKTMMTMPAMSTGKRPEKAKAAIARSVLVGAWFNAILTMRTIMIIVIMMVTQHIPTMTKSHHGGEMSIMIKVGIRDVRPAPPRPAPRKKGCPAPPRKNWQILRGGAGQS